MFNPISHAVINTGTADRQTLIIYT